MSAIVVCLPSLVALANQHVGRIQLWPLSAFVVYPFSCSSGQSTRTFNAYSYGL